MSHHSEIFFAIVFISKYFGRVMNFGRELEKNRKILSGLFFFFFLSSRAVSDQQIRRQSLNIIFLYRAWTTTEWRKWWEKGGAEKAEVKTQCQHFQNADKYFSIYLASTNCAASRILRSRMCMLFLWCQTNIIFSTIYTSQFLKYEKLNQL